MALRAALTGCWTFNVAGEEEEHVFPVSPLPPAVGRTLGRRNEVTMVRKLKHHEQKLLKKVDFINWEVDNNLHEVKVLRKYRIEKREDYTK